MRAVVIVALREVLQAVQTRGFIIGIFMMPLYFALGAAIPRLVAETAPQRYFAVVDREGGFVAEVDQALARIAQEEELRALRAYAQGFADLEALRAQSGALAAFLEDEAVDTIALAAYGRHGGPEGVLTALRPHFKPGTPPFAAPDALVSRVAAPEEIASAAPEAMAGLARRWLEGAARVDTPEGPQPLFAVLLIPEGFGEAADGPPLAYWSANLADLQVRSVLQREFTRILRSRLLAASGVPAETAQALQTLNVRLETFNPKAQEPSRPVTAADTLRTYVPLGFAFLLLLVVFVNANMLLVSVIEEKSNRIAEVVLSSVTAEQFMAGKLLGGAATALTMLTLWILTSSAGLYFLSNDAAQIAATAFDLLFSTEMLPLLLLYFVFGFLIFASVFIAVGSLANSLMDAQSYYSPVMLLTLAPFLLMVFIVRDPNGWVATVASWIPIYTPFIMLFRLPGDPPAWEIAGTAALMIATTVFLVWLMGRIFRANLLNTGQPPSLAALVRMLRAEAR